MTATSVIRQLEKLPARERRKVFAYVGTKLKSPRRPRRSVRGGARKSADDRDVAPSPAHVVATWDYLDASDHKALAEFRCDPRPSAPWRCVKMRLGLSF